MASVKSHLSNPNIMSCRTIHTKATLIHTQVHTCSAVISRLLEEDCRGCGSEGVGGWGVNLGLGMDRTAF